MDLTVTPQERKAVVDSFQGHAPVRRVGKLSVRDQFIFYHHRHGLDRLTERECVAAVIAGEEFAWLSRNAQKIAHAFLAEVSL